MKFFEKIFSVKNNKEGNHKVLTILGLKMKFKNSATTAQQPSNHEYYINAQYNYFTKRLETLVGENLIFIGDSIFNMFNVESIFKAINFGISGTSVKELLDHRDFLNNIKNQNIVLGIGINDIGNFSTEEIIENYFQVIKILIKNNNNLFISEILPVDECAYKEKWKATKLNLDIQKVNKKIQEYMQTTANSYIYSGKYLKAKEEDKLDLKFSVGDGLHLNKKGYEKLEMALKEVLFDSGKNNELNI